MKKIALFLAVVFIATAFSSVAFAAEDFIAIDFRSEAAVKKVASISTNNISEKQFIDGAYEVVTENSDPSISVKFKKASQFNAADYPVLRIDYKVLNGTPTTGQVFFQASTKGFTMGSAGTYTEYGIDSTNMEYQTAVMDMELISSSQWADTIKLIRLDVTTSEGDTVAVRFAGLFKSEKEAYAFDYDKWAAENSADAAVEDTSATTTAPTTDAAATTDTAATTDNTATATTAPQTADPFTAITAVMAISAGAALAIKKRR